MAVFVVFAELLGERVSPEYQQRLGNEDVISLWRRHPMLVNWPDPYSDSCALCEDPVTMR
jgi:hypothetical protein